VNTAPAGRSPTIKPSSTSSSPSSTEFNADDRRRSNATTFAAQEAMKTSEQARAGNRVSTGETKASSS
jgi:hypothetical protein